MGRVIDGRRWRQERIAFLTELLDAEGDGDRRAVIEAELEELKTTKRPRRGLLRWVGVPRLPYEQ